MFNVSVQKFKESGSKEDFLILGDIENLLGEVRERAFQLFESRGGQHGLDLHDWTEAERQVLITPLAELVETENRFEARIALPGFDPKEIQVAALSDALIVYAQAIQRNDSELGLNQNQREVRFSDFGERAIYRRIDLPQALDTATVNATLTNGMLSVTASKAAATRKRTASAAAGRAAA